MKNQIRIKRNHRKNKKKNHKKKQEKKQENGNNSDQHHDLFKQDSLENFSVDQKKTNQRIARSFWRS